jgi:hypothetical protein
MRITQVKIIKARMIMDDLDGVPVFSTTVFICGENRHAIQSIPHCINFARRPPKVGRSKKAFVCYNPWRRDTDESVCVLSCQ